VEQSDAIMNYIIGKLPHSFTLAFSGGSDSTFALRFARNGKRNVNLAFFHHNTKHSDEGLKKAEQISKGLQLKLYVGYLINKPEKNESLEAFWHRERYRFFYEIEDTVVTAHHLQDCMETYIFNMLRGKSATIPYRNKNIIRPFLTFTKEFIYNFLNKNNETWLEDESNQDMKFSRNYIRQNILPNCLTINPGLARIVEKQIRHNMEADNEQYQTSDASSVRKEKSDQV
jgi:tRNA(Ile)-lysidine synthase